MCDTLIQILDECCRRLLIRPSLQATRLVHLVELLVQQAPLGVADEALDVTRFHVITNLCANLCIADVGTITFAHTCTYKYPNNSPHTCTYKYAHTSANYIPYSSALHGTRR